MNLRNIIYFFLFAVFAISGVSCTINLIPKVSYVINSETSPNVWDHATESGVNGEEYYIRKIEPGDVIYYSPTTENKTNGKANIPPILATQFLPIRYIGAIGELKDYEKSFLLAIMGTNTRGEYVSIPSVDDLRKLWNYVMNNLFCVKAKIQTGFFRVMIDYSNLSALALDDNNLKSFLPNSGRRDFIRARSNDSTIYNYFLKGIKPPTNSNFYTASNDYTPFSFISYTVLFNGYRYDAYNQYSELNLWSVYDWINSGIEIPGMVDNKRTISKIGLHSHPSRLKVVPDSLTTGEEYVIEYKRMQDYFFLYSGTKKRIKESDLRYIYPPSVRKMKFK